jgi:HlyD family secretion protein
VRATGNLACLALALAGLPGCTSGRAAKPAAEQDLVVRRGVLAERFLLSGELAAVHSDPLVAPRTPMWELRIRWMEQDGAPVKAGQKVLEFDNAAFAGSLEQKRIAESQAENSLAERAASREVQLADKTFAVDEKRIAREKAETKAAVPRELLTGREWQENQLALEKAQAAEAKAVEDLTAFQKASRAETEVDRIALTKARREIQETEDALDELVLRAPRDGILILGDNRRENRKFQVGDSTWPGSAVVELPDLSEMRVDARLWDVDDGRIVPGLPVRVTLDAFPAEVYPGRIETVAAVAQETSFRSMRRAFTVRVALDRSDPARMRPGMSAKVEVLPPARAAALLAPRGALDLTAKPPTARLADGTDVKVELGACSTADCEITSGLRDGQALRRRG